MVNALKSISWQSNTTLVRVAWVVFPLTWFVGQFVSGYMTLASMAYFLLVSGLFVRHERKAHYRLMSTGIFLDIALVLILQLQRSAVQTAVGNTLNVYQIIHVVFSLLAVIGYIPVVYLGIKRLFNRSTEDQNKLHFLFGLTTFVFRTIGFLFMFSMAK